MFVCDRFHVDVFLALRSYSAIGSVSFYSRGKWDRTSDAMDLELTTHSESDDDAQPFEEYGGQEIASTGKQLGGQTKVAN
jgi:hypothetical protein